jgi:hypothetical protein
VTAQISPFLRRTFIVILALVTSGCASITVVDSWKDESYTELPIQKILIVVTAEDERSRRVAEDSVAKAFREANAEAVAGYTLLPGAVQIDEESIAKAIEGKGFDVVLIASHENTETTSVYVPGEVRTEVIGAPYYGGRGGGGRYNRREYRTIEQPGYYREDKVVTLDTNLYETTGGKLIWSARSQSDNPQSVNDLVEPLAKEIIKHLKLDGFLSQITKNAL